MQLSEFFAEHPAVALGFSGGVDSAFLLWAALHYGAQVEAYYVKTPFQPRFELEDARKLAGQLGARMTVLETDVLDLPQVACNPADRCYHCKNAIFSLIRRQAAADGWPVLIDGTNASDDAGDRPGMRALRELEVRSPLRECGITKQEVRRRSREAGLFTWDKPAYACLATRIPTGRAITHSLLERVEQSEDTLFRLGFTDFRVRVLGEAARLQLPEEQLQTALDRRQEIRQALAPAFSQVLLDLEPRKKEGE